MLSVNENRKTDEHYREAFASYHAVARRWELSA